MLAQGCSLRTESNAKITSIQSLVHWEGTCPLVFIYSNDKAPRPIRNEASNLI